MFQQPTKTLQNPALRARNGGCAKMRDSAGRLQSVAVVYQLPLPAWDCQKPQFQLQGQSRRHFRITQSVMLEDRLPRDMHGRGIMERKDLPMSQQINSEKLLPRGKPTENACLTPSCRELAEQFVELQLLRQKVRAAECEQTREPKMATRV